MVEFDVPAHAELDSGVGSGRGGAQQRAHAVAADVPAPRLQRCQTAAGSVTRRRHAGQPAESNLRAGDQ
jgi:hypothetical protein